MAHETPRHLRFARALALVSGMATPLASGCALQHGATSDAGDDRSDTGPVADAGTDAPYVDPCVSCVCTFGGDTPPPPGSCEALGDYSCCSAVGPLSPPELPA